MLSRGQVLDYLCDLPPHAALLMVDQLADAKGRSFYDLLIARLQTGKLDQTLVAEDENDLLPPNDRSLAKLRDLKALKAVVTQNDFTEAERFLLAGCYLYSSESQESHVRTGDRAEFKGGDVQGILHLLEKPLSNATTAPEPLLEATPRQLRELPRPEKNGSTRSLKVYRITRAGLMAAIQIMDRLATQSPEMDGDADASTRSTRRSTV